MRKILFVMALSMVLSSSASLAGVPGQMSFQGTLVDSTGAAMDTTVSMTFTVYTDSTGGSLVWSETHSAVVVSQGIFNVILGGVNAIPDTAFSGPARWLGIQVGGDPEMEPRQQIVAVGYAFRAAQADTADYARIALTESDGDWTIAGEDVYREIGNVGVGTASPGAKLDIQGDLQVGMDGTGYAVSCYGDSGGGGLFWDETKMALRAGRDDDGTHWLPDSTGQYSLATGWNTKASGGISTSMGWSTAASGEASTAMGVGTIARGMYSTAMGVYTTASGQYSTAMGWETTASGKAATATGHTTLAQGNRSFATGGWTRAEGLASFVSGYSSVASGAWAVAMGYGPTASGVATISLGHMTHTSGDYSVAIGKHITAADTCTIVLGKGLSADDNLVNDTRNSLIVGFNDTTATLFVGGSDHRVGIRTESPTAKLDVNGPTGYDQVRMRTPYTPTGTADTNGNVGDVAWDDDYVYIKTSEGWKRAALSTF